MELLDVRRLTGPGVIWERPGAVMDVRCSEEESALLAPLWERDVVAIQAELGWQQWPMTRRRFSSGTSFVMAAPEDALYTATEALQWVWTSMLGSLGGGEQPESVGVAAERLRELLAAEVNPALMALMDEARSRGLPYLADDEMFSVGFGKHSRSWDIEHLPAPEAVPWDIFGEIPIGLVTGTNGKTTTVRLTAAIAAAAGLRAGVSTTDWLTVDDQVLEAGDFSGPGGARTVLRETTVDIAILETARGGLLRRGLGPDRARAAVITNIAEDHLGDYGSQNLDELLAVKWSVCRALSPEGVLVLNADDPRLVRKAEGATARLLWFSQQRHNPTLAAHVAAGGPAVTLLGNMVTLFDGREWHSLAAIEQIPITLSAVARHNVVNAMAAAGLAHGLGLPSHAIARGLKQMQPADNPGRCNLLAINGFHVLVDFAHNPQGMQAVFEIAVSLPSRRRYLAFSQAGDRTDAEIRELARMAWRIEPERIVISELENYYRGREPGEVFSIIRDELLAAGARPSQIQHEEREMDSLRSVLSLAAPGDLIIMLALGERAQILNALHDLG